MLTMDDMKNAMELLSATSNESTAGSWSKVLYPKVFAAACMRNQTPFYGISIKGYDPNVADAEKNFLAHIVKEFHLELLCQNFGEENYDYDEDDSGEPEDADAQDEKNIDCTYVKYSDAAPLCGHLASDKIVEMVVSYYVNVNTSRLFVAVSSVKKEHIDKLVSMKSLLNKAAPKKDNKGKVNVLTSGYDGLSTQELTLAGVPLELDNYCQETRDGVSHIVKDLKSMLPSGRLTILEGPPGTGKTFLVRSLINEVRAATFIVVPSGMIQKLSDPSIIPVFLEFRRKKIPSDEKMIQKTLESGKSELQEASPIVLIVEDADQCLTSRNDANMESISSILNLTSGILGDAIDIRILATTNTKIDALDKAIVRDGRMSCYVEVGNLSFEEATKVFRRVVKDEAAVLPLKNVEAGYPLARVYKTAKKYAKNKGNPDGLPYLEEDDSMDAGDRFVSKRTKNKKLIGFTSE